MTATRYGLPGGWVAQAGGIFHFRGMPDFKCLCHTATEPAEAGTPYPGTPGRVKLGDQTKNETGKRKGWSDFHRFFSPIFVIPILFWLLTCPDPNGHVCG